MVKNVNDIKLIVFSDSEKGVLKVENSSKCSIEDFLAAIYIIVSEDDKVKKVLYKFGEYNGELKKGDHIKIQLQNYLNVKVN